MIIMLLVSFSSLLKLTFLPVPGRLAVCLLLALFISFSWETATVQSKTEIDGWIHNPGFMLDVAVLLTVDVFLQMSFCILSAKRISGEPMSRTLGILRTITLWIPGLLIFPVLLALLTEVIFSFPGTDFRTIAAALGACMFTAGATLPHLLSTAVPEQDLRLELIFMVNALIALLGVIATVNGRTAVSGVSQTDWAALAGVLTLLAAGAAAGFLLYKRKQNRIK